MTRTWFITGANRGLGRAFTLAALEQGDRVVATAREPESMSGIAQERLTVLPLDVRDRERAIATVDRAFEISGSIDVIVNNAGYGLVGAVEELSEQQIRAQMDTNFYGALWVSQAAIPHLRKQGSGHIVQISTVGAVGSLPLFSLYNASKWALEGFSASMADELRPFGIAVTLAQMGGFDTDWAKSSMKFAEALPAYADTRAGILGMPDYPDPLAPPPAADHQPEWVEPGPEVAAAELMSLVNMPNPPVRRIIGPGAREMVAMALDQRRLDYATDPEFTWPAC
ncbi:SDR family NAD(P)-dependent oxidoreductase [Nocardia huaxiensis]|uniref:SDR family NAD(P)-dependent oxidoreductase n=1 Tax=Nocardia huaxiensis TaxID=2755382 RepID=A0A7D6V9Z4_9NOCA|nr:SDR family NAD(P)-dependent oxidoreductase [Nocardia huaxiensis]QLY30374.1 SDR family NAD(P)-dependent oxidoreductase [Nocardia huaxiensis]UFS95989.1 SDR family NAD(P)-dependent oxidoreductase [Nocardia huaxiensis]